MLSLSAFILTLILGFVVVRKLVRWKREEERQAERLNMAARKYFNGGDSCRW